MVPKSFDGLASFFSLVFSLLEEYLNQTILEQLDDYFLSYEARALDILAGRSLDHVLGRSLSDLLSQNYSIDEGSIVDPHDQMKFRLWDHLLKKIAHILFCLGEKPQPHLVASPAHHCTIMV